MDESDSAALIGEALDRAIAKVAEEEYGRLAEGMSLRDQTASVDKALSSLMELQKGHEPDYNSEWVSLFYLTWFQPRQVHLAYAALCQHIAEQRSPSHVIDYGCGAWAVQFALAILLAEKQELQGSHFFGTCLSITLESMEGSYSCHASLGEAGAHLQLAGKAPACWLTAVHSIYETNETDLKEVFDRICEEQAPALAVVTFREFKNVYKIWERKRRTGGPSSQSLVSTRRK